MTALNLAKPEDLDRLLSDKAIVAASGSRNILKQLVGGLEIGPILMGMGNKAHIVSPSITARGLLNIAALAGTPVQRYA